MCCPPSSRPPPRRQPSSVARRSPDHRQGGVPAPTRRTGITLSNLAQTTAPPRPRSGVIRVASIDVEWTKNYRIKNGNRPFCYSIVWLDLPHQNTPTDLDGAVFGWTSVYVEDPA